MFRNVLDAVTPMPSPAAGRPRVTTGLLALVTGGCAGGLRGVDRASQCPSPIETPVLHAGDTWTYRNEDGGGGARHMTR